MVKTFTRKKILILAVLLAAVWFFLVGRLAYLMLVKSEYYYEKAEALHAR